LVLVAVLVLVGDVSSSLIILAIEEPIPIPIPIPIPDPIDTALNVVSKQTNFQKSTPLSRLNPRNDNRSPRRKFSGTSGGRKGNGGGRSGGNFIIVPRQYWAAIYRR
jgi:hypothetical protein